MPRLRYGSRRVAVEVSVVSLAMGAVVGWLWIVLAPDVVGVVTDDGGIRVGIVPAAGFFPREAILASLAGAAGGILALHYAIRFRMRPVTTLMSLLLGGVAGTAVAWGVGHLFGPEDAVARAAAASAGSEVVMPLTLDAYGLVVAWPLMAALVVLVTALVRDDRHPWGAPAGQPRPIGATTADVR